MIDRIRDFFLSLDDKYLLSFARFVCLAWLFALAVSLTYLILVEW